MDPNVQHLLLERLAVAEGLGDAAVDVVLAACDGPGELAALLRGEGEERSIENAQPELELTPPGAYVASVTVEGFRGVGAPVTLPLTPGPGLTLVVGRNGSGKSSFAEGLELLLTGANSRWVNRTKIWTEGWQNLHHDGDTRVAAELWVDGEAGLLSLARRWERGETLSPGTCEVRRADGSAVSLDDLGWPLALSRYRPFLSYNELGSMFDELKTMYDALAAILGLEDVDDLLKLVRDARLERERSVKGVREQVKALATELDGIDDDRVRGVVAALQSRPPDLDAVELALEGVGEEGDPAGELADLRSLCSLGVPDAERVDAALARLAGARATHAEHAGTDAGRAASLARLLEIAQHHDDQHPSDDCPVCGTAGVIDDRWRADASREISRLSQEARAVEQAERAVREAERAVADLLGPRPPGAVDHARDLGLDPGPLERAWERWAEARSRSRDEYETGMLQAALAELRSAADALAGTAGAELDRREDLWRPVAKRLAAWLPQARAGLAAAQRLDALKAAEAWLKATAADLQAERLAPIAEAARANWETLRQDSNVSLDGFHLRRSGNVRSAEVDVSVDGSDASAFGVMSQGELHALAVSVFLPRAGLAESPFRFMVIDDPVQSMDPAKVDGLARVLDRAAAGRQVVVFTHDERLFEATRRLAIDATVLEVTRRPGSLVEVRKALSPIERAIDDARALLREDELDPEVARSVVPGFVRHALEAACVQAVRRRRLGRGERHAEVEADLARANRLSEYLALAAYDDVGKHKEAFGWVQSRWSARYEGVARAANRGAHEGLDGDLRDFVRDGGILARAIAEDA